MFYCQYLCLQIPQKTSISLIMLLNNLLASSTGAYFVLSEQLAYTLTWHGTNFTVLAALMFWMISIHFQALAENIANYSDRNLSQSLSSETAIEAKLKSWNQSYQLICGASEQIISCLGPLIIVHVFYSFVLFTTITFYAYLASSASIIEVCFLLVFVIEELATAWILFYSSDQIRNQVISLF